MRIMEDGGLLTYPFPLDVDSNCVLRLFDEPEGSTIIEVGAHDEPVSNMLAEKGFKVIGIDLREYDRESPLCNYQYLRADFCDLPDYFMSGYIGRVDSIISISAIEHFGLNTYNEGPVHPYYDVIALRVMWQLLKENGTAYISVPFGKEFIENPPHWRVYNMFALKFRLLQDFAIEHFITVTSGDCEIDGKPCPLGVLLSDEHAMEYDGIIPHVSVVMKLRKISVNRLAPNGR